MVPIFSTVGRQLVSHIDVWYTIPFYTLLSGQNLFFFSTSDFPICPPNAISSHVRGAYSLYLTLVSCLGIVYQTSMVSHVLRDERCDKNDKEFTNVPSCSCWKCESDSETQWVYKLLVTRDHSSPYRTQEHHFWWISVKTCRVDAFKKKIWSFIPVSNDFQPPFIQTSMQHAKKSAILKDRLILESGRKNIFPLLWIVLIQNKEPKSSKFLALLQNMEVLQ